MSDTKRAADEARWEAYLYERQAKTSLAAWVRSLRLFRYCRASGGHADDGDRLLVALEIASRDDLETVFSQLEIPAVILPPDEPRPALGESYKGDEYAGFRFGIQQFPEIRQPGHVRILGVPAHAWVRRDRIEISISDEDDSYEVTERAIESARRVEQLITPMANRIIEPPQDNRYCICPKYHPEFWSPNT